MTKQSLTDRAKERAQKAAGDNKVTLSGALVGLGLLVSALLTIIYLVLLTEEATTLPHPYGYLFGILVGVVAVIPAELAVLIWNSRLESETNITDGQKNTAVTAIVLAGIFSAMTTSSFFSYFLPQLFPPAYLTIAPALNVGAIVGSWIVFLLAIVLYNINSRTTKQNLAKAKASQDIFDARMAILQAAGEAIRAESDKWINQMDDSGVFEQDAQRLIAATLGMNADRVQHPRIIEGDAHLVNGRNGKKQPLTAYEPIHESDNHDDLAVWLFDGDNPKIGRFEVYRTLPHSIPILVGIRQDLYIATKLLQSTATQCPPGTNLRIIEQAADPDKLPTVHIDYTVPDLAKKTDSPKVTTPNGQKTADSQR